MLNSCTICNVEAKSKRFWVGFFFQFPNYTKAGEMGIALIVRFESGMIVPLAQRRKTTKRCLVNHVIRLDTVSISSMVRKVGGFKRQFVNGFLICKGTVSYLLLGF